MNPSLFKLFKYSDDIEEGLSQNFVEALKICLHPQIISIYGSDSIGKSTKINQIINGTYSENYFDIQGPFKTPKEDLNIIKNKTEESCNIFGPIKVKDIIKNNNIDENKISKDIIDNELFFVDSEMSHIFELLVFLQISSIKILYLSDIDLIKLEEFEKNEKLKYFLNIFDKETKNIFLIKDCILNRKLEEEKEQGEFKKELENKKNMIENKVNNYLKNENVNITNLLFEILPSYELAVNNIGNYPSCYKSQMESLVLSICSNIKNNKELNGEKLLNEINKVIDVIKTIKDKKMKNVNKALDLVILELFKEKNNKICPNIIEKVNNLDENIIKLFLSEKNDKIKEYLINELKNELKDSFEFYDKFIHDDISEVLEINKLHIIIKIKEIFDKNKNDINKEILELSEINKNEKIYEIISKCHYREQINMDEINNIIEEIIKSFLDKNKQFLTCLEILEKNYKKNITDLAKKYLKINIDNEIYQKPKWEDALMRFILDIEDKVIEKYKKKLFEEKSYREIGKHLKNGLEKIKEEIDTFKNNNTFIIYNKDDYDKKIENLYNKLKRELNTEFNILKDKREKIIQKTIPDGVYNIVPKHCNNKAIEVNGGSRENMAKILLAEINSNESQQFIVKYNAINQFYIITCLCSNKVLTVNYKDKNNIIQSAKHHGNSQQWHIMSVGNNYEIISEYNELLLEVNSDSIGSNISCKPRTGELNQQFEFKIVQTVNEPKLNIQLNPNYFKPTPYDGVSIIEGLNSIGCDGSYEYRCKIAKANKIESYEGTAEQNTYMLNLLKEGLLKKP